MKAYQVEFGNEGNFSDDYQANRGIDKTNLIEPAILSGHFKNLQTILIKTYLVMNNGESGLSLKDFLNGLEKELIDYCLAFSAGKCNHTATILGVNPTTLCEKMKRLDLNKNKSNDDQLNILKELTKLVIHLKNVGVHPDSLPD